MKILKIKIHQDKANYGVSETVENRMTYPLPFFSTVIGALFSSCHLDRGIDIDVSVQGSYQAMSSEIRTYTVYLNAFAKDRGKMVYTPNPDILYGPIVAVGKEKEFDFIKNENVTVVDKPLYANQKLGGNKMKKLLKAVQAMDDTSLAQYIFDNTDGYEGVTEGIYVTIEDLKFEVRFDNSDIIDYLNMDENTEGEALIEAYENREYEVNLHFLQEQVDRIREELKEQLEA